jgi:hypothetical protein
MMNDQVICRSSSEYAEQPTGLVWEGNHVQISEIVSRGRIPEGKIFRVRTSDERIFDLTYDQLRDEWQIKPGFYHKE